MLRIRSHLNPEKNYAYASRTSCCSYCYCPFLWLDMTKHSTRKLRVAYNSAHRKTLKPHMRCSASQIYVDNDRLNFEALMRKKTNSLISCLTVSDNRIIKTLLGNMIAREKNMLYHYLFIYF